MSDDGDKSTPAPAKLGDEQLAERREIFRSFDQNKDGSLTELELASLLRSLGLEPSQDQLDTLIQNADRNNSGMIEFSEFVALVEPDLLLLHLIIKEADRDGDGCIDFDEFVQAITSAAYDNAWG
ncbi:unnamed protein product [Arabis nemorensis]|uniref:EF-hand domain-containing protein n=1 Tax=Arabis nemorensis TaxID=586526 RepID=A0A565B3M4_9BRAS|nr:unnamed protein product [Arabis nemorensis]